MTDIILLSIAGGNAVLTMAICACIFMSWYARTRLIYVGWGLAWAAGCAVTFGLLKGGL